VVLNVAIIAIAVIGLALILADPTLLKDYKKSHQK
jgi:hypothetical protein